MAGTAPFQPILAQPGQVQAVRPSSAENLNSNLARLATNPRDVNALIGAGEAALDMDDARAAAGFFARADTLQHNNGKVKAGLGRVMLKNQNPGEALRLFDQATRLGYPETSLLSDRGLAKDMTGDQAGAQRDYQTALQRTPDDVELTHRYAASLGISGQVDAAERVLKPLLYKSDRAAWRYRAFILAMNNRQADAKKIAEQTMPAQLATAILPYMQKMPYLTPAQKAAAVHFGHFPANVGTTIAAVTPTSPAFASVEPTQAPTVQTQPQAANATRQNRRARRNGEGATLAQADMPRQTAPLPSAAARTPIPQQPAPQAVQRAAAPAAGRDVQGPPAPGFESAPTTPPAPASSSASQLNAITLAQASVPRSSTPEPQSAPPQRLSAQTAPSTPPAPTAEPAAAAAAPQPQIDPQVTRSLADIIHAIDVPDSERQSNVAAVDLTEIAQIQATRRAERQAAATAVAEKAKKAAAAKAKAEADAKAKQLAEEKKKAAEEKARLAANPSRNWLQVGTGANKGALAFTMKGLRKKYDSLEPQDAWVATWGRTNRLLVGPFSSFTRAKALEDKLKSAGADVFAWKSDAGEVVERLSGQ
nr:SPOR domain-containing protein [Sphingobium sp. EM0848]